MRWTPQSDGASPVIMVRSLPPGTSEQELVVWAKSFVYEPRDASGNVTGLRRYADCIKALVLHDRMLGFVQFSDIWAARAAMAQFMCDPPSIVLRRPDGVHPLNLVYSDKPEIKAQNRGRQIPQAQPVYTNSRLLLVVLKELSQTVTIDELFWVFSQISRVEKISSFTKDNKNQIVVQFETPDGATAAMEYFNGKYLPAAAPINADGTPAKPLCFLAIVPSKLPQLTFRNQDGRNRDYTEANKLIADMVQNCPDKESANYKYNMLWRMSNMTNRQPLHDFIWGLHRWGEGWLHPPQSVEFRGRVPEAQKTGATVSQGQVGDCMHISGLPSDDSLTAEHLWNLCGMYGTVKAVKMLFKYRGCVVVQFTEPTGCSSAIKHLHGLGYRGRTWDAKISRQPNATHWHGASDDLQKRMVSAAEGRTQPPSTPESATYPNPTLLLWDVGQVPPEFVSMAIASLTNVVPQAVTMGLEPDTMLLRFNSTDEAVTVAMMANGRSVSGWAVKLRFDPSKGAAPAAASFFRMGQPQTQQQQQQPPLTVPSLAPSTHTTPSMHPLVMPAPPLTPPLDPVPVPVTVSALVSVQLEQERLQEQQQLTLHRLESHNASTAESSKDDDDDLLRQESNVTSPATPGQPGLGGKRKGRKAPPPPGLPRPASKPSSVKSETGGTPTQSPGLLMLINDTAPSTALNFPYQQKGTTSPWGTPATCKTEPGDSAFTARLMSAV